MNETFLDTEHGGHRCAPTSPTFASRPDRVRCTHASTSQNCGTSHDGGAVSSSVLGQARERVPPEDVAAATIVGITDGSLTEIRGGQTRTHMIELNRGDPAAVDALLNGRKSELEQAGTAHASL